MLTEILVAAAIVSLCLLLHVATLLFMAECLLRRRDYLARGGRSHYAVIMIVLFSGILLLHVVETSLWAGFYYTRGLFADFETGLYFSLTSYTTIGYGDVLLPEKWRLLGALEGITGVLLCGISTAFFFAVMTAMFQIRLQQNSAAPLERI